MARGGARAGAGRKEGGRNLKSRRIADKAAQEGITPLEVILIAMRARLEAAERLQGDARLAELDKAAERAKDAAAYMHPRLSQVAAQSENKVTIQVSGGLPDAGN